MRGRYPSGPEYVDDLPGSTLAKDRTRVILQTMAGQCRIQEACEQLDISEPRFYQLRLELLNGGIAAMEPGHAGRPPHTVTPEQLKIAELEKRLGEMEVELKAAQARAEIALVLPKVVHPPDSSRPQAADPGKKTRRRQRPTPGKKRST